MSSARIASLAGVAVLFATVANAADLPLKAPPIEEYVAGGWYLRGDIGMSNQRVGSMFNALYNDPAVSSVANVQKGFDSAPLFGLGIGYQWNDWLRFDVTGEYRGKANFHGFDIVTYNGGGGLGSDEYRGSKSEWLMLANVYADLGTWYSFTPFVGAGIGTSRNTISNFMDVNTPTRGVAYGGSASKWNLAWALHAGVSYQVNSRLAFEFAYRYVDLGNAASGDLATYTGMNDVYNPMEFKHITSHDLKFGLRWMLEPPMPAYPVMLPPLQSRG